MSDSITTWKAFGQKHLLNPSKLNHEKETEQSANLTELSIHQFTQADK